MKNFNQNLPVTKHTLVHSIHYIITLKIIDLFFNVISYA